MCKPTQLLTYLKFVSNIITCSAAAPSTVLRAGWLSYGRCDFWTPHSSAPNEAIIMKFCTCDYVMETTPLAIFTPYLCQSTPWNGVKYNGFVRHFFVCLFFLVIAARRDESADFHDLGVKWRHFAEGSAFWGLELYLTPFGVAYPQKPLQKGPQRGNSSQNKKSENLS